MSFMLTKEQIRAKTKTVTRRLGWKNLQPGQQIQACVKCQGLKPGEKMQRLCVLEIVSVRRERLDAITQQDCRAEGFPHLTPAEFVEMFCREMGCKPETEVHRIQFTYH
jgi:hypothetical protein